MSTLYVGVARTEITPPIGTDLCGYGPFLDRVSTGVHDPLWCRAIAIENGDEVVVLVSCDLIGVHQALTDAVRLRIQETFGIEPARVMIACTHTHAGPNTLPHSIGLGEPDEGYRAGLGERIVETVAAAMADRRSARLSVGRTVHEGIGRNRVQPDGTGLLDPELTVLRFADEAGRIRALVFHYGLHPVVTGPQNRLVSGDWVGNAVHRLENGPGGPAVACFLNGTCGDINPVVAATSPPDWDAVDSIGARMQAAVTALLPSMHEEAEAPLAAQRTTIPLPLASPERAMIDRIVTGYDHTPREGNDPFYVTGIPNERLERTWAEAMQTWGARPASERDNLPCELQAIRIGPLALIGVPGEVFTALGLAIKQQSPFRMTAVVGYANHFVGYIPRQQDYADPTSYAAHRAPKYFGLPSFTPMVGDVLVRAAHDVLASLRSTSGC